MTPSLSALLDLLLLAFVMAAGFVLGLLCGGLLLVDAARCRWRPAAPTEDPEAYRAQGDVCRIRTHGMDD